MKLPCIINAQITIIKLRLRNGIWISPHGSSRAGLRNGFLWERVTSTTELVKRQNI